MSAEMFSALVTARLRSVEGIVPEGGKGLELWVNVRGEPKMAQLERYYARYRARPEDLTPLIEDLIDSLVSGRLERAAANEEFERVAPTIFPRLMTAQQWMNHREAGERLVIRPVAQDLGAALVIDRQAEWEFVQLEQIPAWGMDAQAVYERALANLERTWTDARLSVNGAGVETLLVDASVDGYAAARILLPSRLAEMQSKVDGDLVLGAPTRDLLLGFSRKHPALAELRAQVAEDAAAEPNGLLAHLLIARGGALERFD